MFLVAALAAAGMLFAVVANFGDEPFSGRRLDDRVFWLGVLAVGFAGLIGLPGVVLTVFYVRRPYGWIRSSYRALLFLVVVANVLIFATGAPFVGWGFCWDCGLEVWWTQTIVPASLFIAFAPPAKAFLARYPAWQRTQQRLHRRAVLLRDGTVESLFGTPVRGATFPRVMLWLAGVPWLSWLMGTLMIASEGRTSGGLMLIVIPVVYVAAFYATVILTPVLAYLTVRYLRNMPRAAQAWTLAGLLAAVRCYRDAAGAFSVFM